MATREMIGDQQGILFMNRNIDRLIYLKLDRWMIRLNQTGMEKSIRMKGMSNLDLE